MTLDKYYQQLFEQVQNIMREGEIPPDAHKVLQVTRSATWGQPTSWTVYYPLMPDGTPDETQPRLRRLLWRSAVDIRRMNQTTQPIQPTLTRDDLPLDAAQWHTLWAHGRRIRVPLLDVRMVSGFDGTHYTMLIPPTAHSPIKSPLYLEWWEHAAEEWKPFSGWVMQLITFFETPRAVADDN